MGDITKFDLRTTAVGIGVCLSLTLRGTSWGTKEFDI